MTDERNNPPVQDAKDDSRRQLWTRAAVAVGLIGLLLGSLIVFDEASRPPEAEEAKVPAKPIGPAPVAGRESEPPPDVVRAGGEAADQASSAPPLPVAADQGEPLKAARKADDAADETRPVVGAGARTVLPESPAVASSRSVTLKEDTLRGGVAPLAATPAAAPAGAPSAPAGAPQARREPVGGGLASPPGSAPAAVAPQAEVRPPADGRAAPARGYVVQVGGFMEPAAAEDLRARLARGGVPVQLESRVMVGPFADRREALAAQSRLREQGYAPGVIQPSR